MSSLICKNLSLTVAELYKKNFISAFQIIRNIAATQQKKYNIMHTSQLPVINFPKMVNYVLFLQLDTKEEISDLSFQIRFNVYITVEKTGWPN